jgi:hypothetical protein
VASHDLHNLPPAGDRLAPRGLRQLASRRGVSRKKFSTLRSEEKEQSGFAGVNVERVTDAPRRVHERAGDAFDDFVAVPSWGSPSRMTRNSSSSWWECSGDANPLRGAKFEGGEPPVGLCGVGPQQPQRRAF